MVYHHAGIRFPRHVAAVDVLDVAEAELFQNNHGLAAAVAAGAIDQHGLFFVEGRDLRFKGLVADGNVYRIGQRTAFKFTGGAHI